jgi:nitrite reductase (NADH) small subunit
MPDQASPLREFVTVGLVGDMPPGKGRQVTVLGRWVAVFNINGTHHAIDAICLHQGGPLAEGLLAGCVVTCPWHGWQYDVTSGAFVQDPRIRITRHETRILDGQVQVRLTD